jgi:hypothetical protein
VFCFVEHEDFSTVLPGGGNINFVLRRGRQRQCIVITALPDNEVEGDELLTVQLTSDSPSVTVLNNEVLVTILGDQETSSISPVTVAPPTIQATNTPVTATPRNAQDTTTTATPALATIQNVNVRTSDPLDMTSVGSDLPVTTRLNPASTTESDGIVSHSPATTTQSCILFPGTALIPAPYWNITAVVISAAAVLIMCVLGWACGFLCGRCGTKSSGKHQYQPSSQEHYRSRNEQKIAGLCQCLLAMHSQSMHDYEAYINYPLLELIFTLCL